MLVDSTEPTLFFSRTLAHLCAPVFVLLTGLSAFLYGEKHQGTPSMFLFKRGLFLVVLEFTLVNFAWTFQFPPAVIYLQVIWAIGVSMIALSVLAWLPRPVLCVLGLAIIGLHNLLDPLHFPPGSALHLPWAILHDRGWIEFSEQLAPAHLLPRAAVDRGHSPGLLHRPLVRALNAGRRASALSVVGRGERIDRLHRPAPGQWLRRGAVGGP